MKIEEMIISNRIVLFPTQQNKNKKFYKNLKTQKQQQQQHTQNQEILVCACVSLRVYL